MIAVENAWLPCHDIQLGITHIGLALASQEQDNSMCEKGILEV